jgi:hypothetical protein
MVVVELGGVEVDHCQTCRGTWFDAGELELVAELAGSPPGRLAEVISHAGQGSSRRPCPRCGRKMRLVRLAGASPVEVDRCPAGHGVWLDAGELGALVRAFAGREDPAVAAFFGDLFRHELTGQSEEN